MQSVSSRIWTRFAVSISHDDSHYTTGINICLDFAREQKPGNMRVFWITIASVALGEVTKRLKRIWNSCESEENGDRLDYSIVEIDKNT